MIKLLLDANLSPLTATYLHKLNIDTKSITQEHLGHLIDKDVAKLAQKEKRIIVTFDLDFGEIYYYREKGKIGVVVLRLKNQTVESVNFILGNFLHQYLQKLEQNPHSLVIIKPNSARFITS